MRSKRKLEPASNNQKAFSYPSDALLLLSCSVVIFIVDMSPERAINFWISYPMTFTMIGVMIPMVVIVKSKKMSHLLVKTLTEDPAEVFRNLKTFSNAILFHRWLILMFKYNQLVLCICPKYIYLYFVKITKHSKFSNCQWFLCLRGHSIENWLNVW